MSPLLLLENPWVTICIFCLEGYRYDINHLNFTQCHAIFPYQKHSLHFGPKISFVDACDAV